MLASMTSYCIVGLQESAYGNDTLFNKPTKTPHYPHLVFPLTRLIDHCTKTRFGHIIFHLSKHVTWHRDSEKV